MKTLVLIDSNAIIHRAYHALPKNMKTSKGELTNVIYGYATTLVKVLEDLKPDYIAASFDLAGKTFRHEEYKEYKAQRVKADQELYDQIPRVRELLSVLNIPVYEMAGFEADDVIGTIADKFEIKGHEMMDPRIKSEDDTIKKSEHDTIDRNDFKVYIVTGDKDAFQLVDGNIFVYNLKHGLLSAQVVDRESIRKEWGLAPEDFIDLKALAGDPSDNIPGVPGIGNKTATALLQKFDSLVKLYETIEKDSSNLDIKPRILNLLIENKAQAFLSQRLATIRRDVLIDFDLEKSRWGDYDRSKLKDFFEEMQFHSLLRRFSHERGEVPKTKESEKKKEQDEQLKLL